jgi:hypothetical protein
MLPGSVLLVFGVRARRGRSVGGRGAGRASINWLFEYMLREGQQGGGCFGLWRVVGKESCFIAGETV